jgi:hypothetical protein
MRSPYRATERLAIPVESSAKFAHRYCAMRIRSLALRSSDY